MPALATLLVALAAHAAPADIEPEPRFATVAERSAWRSTATSNEVEALVDVLAASSPQAVRLDLGRTVEDRPIPLLVLGDPPPASPEALAQDPRLRILLFGNIHAGEVCGKEALLMLAREVLHGDDAPFLRDAVLLLVPNLNADGNDRMDPGNRPGQVGPEEGMGQRANAQGLDLNRDWVKLESPEIRAMARALTAWDPHLIVDTHTTNGSKHRYQLTYDAPSNPAGFMPSILFVRDGMLPRITERLRAEHGYETFFYGNFGQDHRVWATYGAQPRYGAPCHGLRGQMSILSEAYAYADYRTRVLATLAFCRAIVQDAVEHADAIRTLHDEARAATVAAGAHPQPQDVVPIRQRIAAHDRPALVKGYALAPDERGRLRPTDEPADHLVVHLGRFEPALVVSRPRGYVLEPGLDAVAEKLRQHGIAVEPFAGAATVETWTVARAAFAPRPFQGHRELALECTAERTDRTFPKGSWLVRTAQPLGTLACYLLEPMSDDGLHTWNMLDDFAEVGRAWPVHRVVAGP